MQEKMQKESVTAAATLSWTWAVRRTESLRGKRCRACCANLHRIAIDIKIFPCQAAVLAGGWPPAGGALDPRWPRPRQQREAARRQENNVPEEGCGGGRLGGRMVASGLEVNGSRNWREMISDFLFVFVQLLRAGGILGGLSVRSQYPPFPSHPK